MQPKKIWLFFLVVLSFKESYGQNKPDAKINTSAAAAYFKIVSALQHGMPTKDVTWQTLFQTPIYQMLIGGKAVDTTVLKTEMLRVYTSAVNVAPAGASATEKYHYAYKQHLKALENYTGNLGRINVIDSVKRLLYPFIPSRLQKNENFPVLFYLNYGSADATGSSGFVINDLLQSYRVDQYKFGLMAAHEAFHAVVSVAFQQKLKPDANYNAADFNLLYFLEIVSEEGIADLIDKPLLLQKRSPLYTEVKALVANDEIFAVSSIKKLDSVLTLANSNEAVIQQYANFSDLANAFGKNGGHIPGRFMGNLIKTSGLLSTHLKRVEDPISFVAAYNKSVISSHKNYPIFSKESLAYLKRVSDKYFLKTAE